MAHTFALSKYPTPGDEHYRSVDLWCEWISDKLTKNGRPFHVINGEWNGWYDADEEIVYCDSPRGVHCWPGKIVWEGEVPARDNRIHASGGYRDYNSAMIWIREQIS